MELADTTPYEPLTDASPEPSPNFSSLEQVQWALQPDLDVFFSRVYKYWQGKGFFASLLKEMANLAALLFFFLFSTFLLFFMNWSASKEDCEEWEGTCDIAQLYLQNPLHSTSLSTWMLLRLTYMLLFSLYVMVTLIVGVNEVRSAWHIRNFCKTKLGVSEEQIKWVKWEELVHRLVLVQRTTRLCRQKDLKEFDIINRILRKENYLVGMINKGILNLTVPCIGYSKRNLLTKMVEWSLRWGLLNPMFDGNFEIRDDYRTDARFLTRRFRLLAIVNLLLAPFLLVFLVIYFLMMNLERLHSSPIAMTERSWTAYAVWSMREFNELEHQLEARISRSAKPAQDYIDQFPSYCLMHVGKLLSFVLESFAALLLGVALIDDSLMEHGMLLGHTPLWWMAILMIGLRLVRGLVPKDAVLDPDSCMEAVAEHTRFYPALWQRHGRSKEVQQSFCRMFRYRALNFLDEVLSIVLAPYILYFSLPRSSESIVQFLRDYTVRFDGVGDVCSLAAFDFEQHEGKKQDSADFEENRIRQGKIKNSFLSFAAAYPNWQPPPHGQELLASLHRSTDSSPSRQNRIASVHPNHAPLPGGGSSRTSNLQQSASTIEMSTQRSSGSSKRQ